MAAHDPATVTIDTGEWVYIDNSGNPHTVTNGQTFVMALAAGGAGEKYTVTTGELTCTDGTRIIIERDPTYTQFTAAADATARLWPNVGTFTCYDPDDNTKAIWDVRTVTINNIDQPTAITTMVFERRDNPLYTFTWSGVTVAQ